MKLDYTDRLPSESAKARIVPLINQMTDTDYLNSVILTVEDRIKALVRTRLAEEDPILDLRSLDTIWHLTGDRQISFDALGHKKGNLREIEYYVGRKVHHVLGIGVIALLKDGSAAIRLKPRCRCGRRMTLYAKPGVHLGGFAYAYDSRGKRLGDLRNIEVTCGKCSH
jgi:hypothetical protein